MSECLLQNINLEKLNDEITIKERILVQRSSGFSNEINKQKTDFNSIKNTLKQNQAFIQFNSFPLFNGKNWVESTIYVAYIIKLEEAKPEYIPLFEKRSLDSLLTSMDESSLVNNLYNNIDHKLFNLAWKPLTPFLKNVTEIYYSVSGLLNKVSFAFISDNSGHYLSDNYTLHQVIAPRSFLFSNDPTVFSKNSNYTSIFCCWRVVSSAWVLRGAADPPACGGWQ